jgi:alcohol dehydrogenase
MAAGEHLMTGRTMKAWRLERLGGALSFEDIPIPAPRPGSVLVRLEVAPLMSYLKAYVEGKLAHYAPPPGPFTIGTNAVGVVEAVGADVHIKPGRRVVVSSHFVARENAAEPAQILIGLTAGAGEGGEAMLADWPDGTLAEYALAPAETVFSTEGLGHIAAAELAAVTRFVIPFGGLLRGRLAVGETLIVNGATGAYGAAAALLGAAMGARVVAVGRDRAALAALAKAGAGRIETLPLKGAADEDAAALRAASGGADMAFDMVGRATDPHSTLAALHSLRRNGRLVLMGSMTVPLPIPYAAVMLNNWEIIGQFMYPRDAYRRLIGFVRSGKLDLSLLTPRIFPLAKLPEAMDAAGRATSLEYIVVRP